MMENKRGFDGLRDWMAKLQLEGHRSGRVLKNAGTAAEYHAGA